MQSITVLGLGEAGRLYAADLAGAGFPVCGYDPFTTIDDGAVRQVADLGEAVGGADVVISLVGARAALDVAVEAAGHLRDGAVYADFNTASPESKRRIAHAIESAGALFADVAVLAPVPRAGIGTPLMASGSGASVLAAALTPAPVEAIDGAPGDAAARKLLRSVFMKGLAGVVLETAEAGRRAGMADWVIAQMAAELGPEGDALVDRLIRGSYVHANRRRHEVADALDYVRGLGLDGWMAAGALSWLTALDAEEAVRRDDAGTAD